MIAPEILFAGAEAIADRAKERDQASGERTAGRAADIFNAITGRRGAAAFSTLDAWLFLVALKLARSQQGAFKLDDYVDLAAYAALAGECAAEMADELARIPEREAALERGAEIWSAFEQQVAAGAGGRR